VARALRPGGLYVFDRYMMSSWTNPARSWSWSKRRGGLIVRASFSALNDVDPVSQVFRERMELEAVENGTRRVYRQQHLSRMVFPQELKALVEIAGGFEFVQWFFGFKPHQVLERSKHPLLMVVVLRRKLSKGASTAPPELRGNDRWRRRSRRSNAEDRTRRGP
jgi:hypothetical protein